MRYLRICLALVLAMTAHWVQADENPFCGPGQAWGAPVTGQVAAIRAGMVTAGATVLLRGLADNPAASCGRLPCLVSGGVAGIELQHSGSWICIGVPGKGKLGTMFGWLPATRWHRYEGGGDAASQWLGVWQNEEAKITVQRAAAGQLKIQGHGLWVGGPLSQPHFGDFEITGIPTHGVLATSGTYLCQVAVRLVGNFLVAADNGACGGMNVTFDGMYRLRHR